MPLGIIAIVTRSHTAGHCCDMMYLFTKSKQTSRCASDMARRWSYRSSEEPGAEFMFLAWISPTKSSMVISTRTPVKSTRSVLVSIFVNSAEAMLQPSKANPAGKVECGCFASGCQSRDFGKMSRAISSAAASSSAASVIISQ